MCKFFNFLFAAVLCCGIYSCKKENKTTNVNSTLAAYPTEIVGTWLSVKTHIKVFGEDDGLLKDTTEAITNTWDNAAWNEVYNKDGSGYKIYYMAGSSQLLPDTNSTYKYTIAGTNLTLFQPGGSSEGEPILNLDSSNMELEETYYSNIINPNLGITFNETFKFIIDTYYKKL